MYCKNCGSALRTDYTFCPHCGAKVIRNRITLKNLWYDAVERFFNLDNTFIRTFVALFTKPEVVMAGYISGVRKKYMNPISYLTIALALTSILVFFIKRSFPEGLDFDLMKTGIYPENSNKRMTNFLLNYYNVFVIIQLPFYAISGWLAFKNVKQNNLPEFFVIFIYLLSHQFLFSLPLSVSVILFFPKMYLYNSFLMLVISIVYSIYVLKRLFGPTMSFKEFCLKSIVFLLLFGTGFLVMGIGQGILMVVLGILPFPPPN